MSAKELKEKLKALRNAHAGKPVGKMSADEMMAEIEHHEASVKARETKAKRLAALAAAREARKRPTNEVVEPVAKIPKSEFVKEHKSLVKVLEKGSKKEQKKEAVAQKKELKKVKYVVDSDSEMSSTDEETEYETIRSRIQKKKPVREE